ncbi:MAG: trypco2 family protein [Thermoanaerobaculia bacterium]
MKSIVRSVLAMVLLVVGGTSGASAQDEMNIADLVLAVRQGLIEAQQRQAKASLVPMFLVKDFEMTITFVVEKGATGGVNLKVVTLGGNIKKEQTHTVTIRSETAAFEHVKARLSRCLNSGPNRTYPACFNQAYKELGLTQRGAGIHR